MARRFTRGRGFQRPAPKTKVWIGAGFSDVTLVSGAEKLITVLSASAALLRSFTILRSRIALQFHTDQGAASEHPTGAMGYIVVTDQASGVGITALPAPIAEPDADWFIYQGLLATIDFGDNTGFTQTGNIFTIDSKAMRKVGPNQDVVSIIEMRSQGGAIVNGEGRILVQLH